jgi:hypothetical protein
MLTREARTSKSTSANLCAVKMSAVARQLENAVREGAISKR